MGYYTRLANVILLEMKQTPVASQVTGVANMGATPFPNPMNNGAGHGFGDDVNPLHKAIAKHVGRMPGKGVRRKQVQMHHDALNRMRDMQQQAHPFHAAASTMQAMTAAEQAAKTLAQTRTPVYPQMNAQAVPPPGTNAMPYSPQQPQIPQHGGIPSPGGMPGQPIPAQAPGQQPGAQVQPVPQAVNPMYRRPMVSGMGRHARM